MSRLNSKLVLKTIKLLTPDDPYHGTQGFKIVKSVNTLDYGVPGEELTREQVDKILREARGHRPGGIGTLTVEFIGDA